MLPILLATLGLVIAAMLALWIVSLRTADVSVVDIFWGLGFAGVAWASHAMGGETTGPLVMTVLLVEISGVRMLESTIVERRPAYRAYIARTSAFVPWPPRSGR